MPTCLFCVEDTSDVVCVSCRESFLNMRRGTSTVPLPVDSSKSDMDEPHPDSDQGPDSDEELEDPLDSDDELPVGNPIWLEKVGVLNSRL